MRLLKTHNAYEKYFKYWKEENGKRALNLEVIHAQQAISGAFLWHHTVEGGKFWNAINKEWFEKLGVNNNNLD